MENFSRIQIENAKEAYIALFNALGPEHYATLEAEFKLALRMYEDNNNLDKRKTAEYAKEAFNGLSRKDKEELAFPLVDAAVLYANTLLEMKQEEEFIKLYDYIQENFTDTAEEDDRIEMEDYVHLTLAKGECLITLGENEEAKDTLKSVYTNYLDNFGFDDLTEIMLLRIVELLINIKEKDTAEELLNKTAAFKNNEIVEEYDDDYYDDEEASPEDIFPLTFVKMCKALFLLEGEKQKQELQEVLTELDVLEFDYMANEGAANIGEAENNLIEMLKNFSEEEFELFKKEAEKFVEEMEENPYANIPEGRLPFTQKLYTYRALVNAILNPDKTKEV